MHGAIIDNIIVTSIYRLRFIIVTVRCQELFKNKSPGWFQIPSNPHYFGSTHLDYIRLKVNFSMGKGKGGKGGGGAAPAGDVSVTPKIVQVYT